MMYQVGFVSMVLWCWKSLSILEQVHMAIFPSQWKHFNLTSLMLGPPGRGHAEKKNTVCGMSEYDTMTNS